MDGSYYALDWRKIIFCKLTEEYLDILKSCLNNTEDWKLTPFAKLYDKNIFMSPYPDPPVPKYNHDRINISFAPIQECNLSCKYCFAHDLHQSQDRIKAFDKDSVNRLIDYVYFDKYKNFQKFKFDFVSGGEPLLNFDVLEFFLRRVREIDKKHNKKTTVLVVTNATLLTSDVINKLDQYDVFLGISIDGGREVHDSQRVYKDGSGTYNDVVNSIVGLKNSKASAKLKSAWAMSVITPNTGSLVKLMENCIDLGFNRMQMQLLRVAKDHPLRFDISDIPVLMDNYRALFSHIIAYAEKGDLSRLKMIANDNDSFGKFFKRLLLRRPVFYRCFAGRNKISIAPDGSIYPCDSFCGNKDYEIGSINEPKQNEPVLKLFQNIHVQNRKKCSTCWARYICGGDCYYNSLDINGNPYEPDEFTCTMNRFFIENAVDLLMKLQSFDKNNLLYLAKILNVIDNQ